MTTSSKREISALQDILGETLYSLRLEGALYSKSELTAPWGIDMPPMEGKMMFHILTKGECWLRLANHEDIYLAAGDIALLPRGEGHQIACDQSVECKPFFEIPATQVSERFERIQHGGNGEESLLTCGVINLDNLTARKLVSQLPPLIHITSKDSELPASLQTLSKLMEKEAETLRAGGEAVLSSLADIIVIQVIRYWIEHAPEANEGWLGALKDPKIGKALALMHDHPEYAWTLDQLSHQVGMSRSGFSARFTEVMDISAKQYLTEWRMAMARQRIMHSPVSLIELAEEFGYTSEAAFSRAYKRVFGVPPLRERRFKQLGSDDN
ncbi:AraC family transcriptional regulator [Marinomonas atlantica]|uniref:AraC family transcriptional regulator n=1 Tax=Marinomonas atlantica TaxID=1806668 RepID=UPI000A8DEB9E|nr:AraC family transcriptional regulator [Marinomonas atlantica]